MSSIEIAGLTKNFGPAPVVKGIDLSIRAGEFVTLLGPSGSGKTTTLRMVAGLERASGGTISVGGVMMDGAGVFVPPYRRGMGMVFQSYAIWPHRTVYQNVAFPLRMKRIPRAEEKRRVERILELVELPAAQFGARYASQLSGGQQQRVSLARALVGDPAVVLYDEPLSNLDARLRESMRILLRSIHNRIGLTALYVTHDQVEAMVLAHRVCVMNGGRIVQEGTPRALYDRPADAFVAEFVGQANILPIADASRGDGTVRLQDGTTLRVAEANWPSDMRRPSRLVIRHHHVVLHSTAAAPNVANLLPATLGDMIYLGDRMRSTLTLSPGLSLISERISEKSGAEPGTAVLAELLPEHCIVI
jgi:ABC-type Fe3+/spermidine/putrescine transport system ATPase subunit